MSALPPKADIRDAMTAEYTARQCCFAHFVRDRRNQWQEGHVDGRSDLWVPNFQS
jgi:hypothetical protein